MKKLFLACMTLVMSCAAYSQNYLTIKGGLDLSKPSSEWPFDYRLGAGFQLGTAYSIGLPKNFYVEPGINLSYHTWKWPDIYIAEGTSAYTLRFKSWSANIPIVVGYSIPVGAQNLNIYTGPQLSINLGNKLGVVNGPSGEAELDNHKQPINRFGLGWKGGISCTLDRYIIGVEGTWGITKLMKDVYYTSHQNVYSIYLGYSF